MKISKSTLEILKNFGTINTNILFREGSTLRTMTVAKNIFAVAEVEEEFPQEFAIYDLNSLLALLSTAGESDEVKFGEKSLKISAGGGEFEYFFADPSIITAAPAKTIEVDKHFQFSLTKADVDMLTKAAAIVAAPTINIVSKKGVVVISVGDPDTPGSNSFKRVVGKSKHDFDCRLAIENFRIIPLDYDVTLSAKKVLQFKNKERLLQYWLALDPKSVITAGSAADDDDEEEAPKPKAKAKAKPAPEPEPEDDDDAPPPPKKSKKK